MPDVFNLGEYIENEIPQEAQRHPERWIGMDATIQFNIYGERGGRWHLRISEGEIHVYQGPAVQTDVSLNILGNDLTSILKGSIDVQMAFMSGKLKVSGDTSLAFKFLDLIRN